ncbi:MAG TPA: nitrous oxide-stimulated promoter family protein [Candidatus Saccharimonadales bacterium]|nr:nitrous oxide-stimulated promoter family protein [Candidatus Saccharimonadales bacterium]
MTKPGPRIAREQRTIRAMVDIYCRDHHPPDGRPRCVECDEFLAYACKRLERCVFGESKPVCNDCPVHCYKPDRKAQARTIMRHSGPKMIFYHPLQAILHMLEARKEPPVDPRRARRADPIEDEVPVTGRPPSEDSQKIPLPPFFI